MDLPKFLNSLADLWPPRPAVSVWLIALVLLITACTAAPEAATTAVPPTAQPLAASTAALPATPPPTAVPPTQPPPTPSEAAEIEGATAVPATTTAPPTAVPTPSPTDFVNGIPVSEIVVLPPETAAHIQEIFAQGQEYGRNAHAFSKLGDSAVLVDSYLTRFDDPTKYTLGEWAFLQPTIDFYAGSFRRYGVATRVGLSSWGVMDPTWANKEFCNPNEVMLACEIRLFNPSILLIHLGTNDIGEAETFEANMRTIVEFCLLQGIIPILATKADRFEGEDNHNNQILIDLAAEYQVPLWDFDAVAATLPGRGLDEDQIHLTKSLTNNYTDPDIWSSGYPVSDLTALLMLDAVRQTVEGTQ
jgi:hypothetical protein